MNSSFFGHFNLPYIGNIVCGFPSPSQDYMDKSLDLLKEIIQHPSATYCGRAVGDSMIEAGIHKGDILIIDKSLDPQHGDIVVARFNGQNIAKYLDLSKKELGIVKLVSANPRCKPIIMHDGDELVIFGVVSSVIKRFRH